MKKLSALIITALLLVSAMAFAGKPGSQPDAPPLKALWIGLECAGFVFFETESYVTRSGNRLAVSRGSGFLDVSEIYATEAEATDAIITFFILVNGLDMTLADVPVDGTGAYDCRAWNYQLIGL